MIDLELLITLAKEKIKNENGVLYHVYIQKSVEEKTDEILKILNCTFKPKFINYDDREKTEIKVKTKFGTFEIDKCLVNEIKELNNIRNIETSLCCCGHKYIENGLSYICIKEKYVKDMINLGYELHPYWKNSVSYLSKITFVAKSKCFCRENVGNLMVA